MPLGWHSKGLCFFYWWVGSLSVLDTNLYLFYVLRTLPPRLLLSFKFVYNVIFIAESFLFCNVVELVSHLCFLSKKSFLTVRSPTWSPNYFKVLLFTFRSLIHLELIFMDGVIFHMKSQMSHFFYRIVYSLSLNCSATAIINQIPTYTWNCFWALYSIDLFV